MADPERQRPCFRKTPMKPAVGEEERVPYKRTPGNKKPGSASSRVRMRVPQDSQSVSTVVSIPASFRSISWRRALRSRMLMSFISFLLGGAPSISTIRISMAEEMDGSLRAARRFSLFPSRYPNLTLRPDPGRVKENSRSSP